MTATLSFASLSPALLARKGAARPAMRRPDALCAEDGESIDDLGWNDFGSDADPVDATPVPPVLRQLQAAAIRLAQAPLAASLTSGTVRRAAFTLRLDIDRHQRLRLAGSLLGRSAQSVVTEALDQYLAGLPDPSTGTTNRSSDQSRKRRHPRARGE